MKKYLPTFLFIFTFTAILSGQIFFDLFSISANSGNRDNKQNLYLEKIYEKSVFRLNPSRELVLSDLKSQIVIINFWASWCQPCLMEVPGLVKLRTAFSSDDLEIIGVNTDDENQTKVIDKVSKRYGINFTIVPDENSKILNDFLVASIPYTVIFHKGKVHKIITGAMDFEAEEFILELRNLLKQN